MKISPTSFCCAVALFSALAGSCVPAFGQLYTPSATVGASLNGNVGVGTNAPNSPLQVQGILGVSGGGANYIIDNSNTLRLGYYDTSISKMGYIQAPYQKSLQIWNHATYGIAEFRDDLSSIFFGKVGIGTNAPTTQLHINDGDLRISDLAAGQVAAIGLDSAVGTGDLGFSNQGSLKFIIRGHSDAQGGTLDLADRTNGHVTRLYIAGNGNVGIGTTSPLEKLQVAGNIRQVASGRIDNEFLDSSGGLDAKIWSWSINGATGANSFALISRDDGGTFGQVALQFGRSGKVITSTLIPNGNVGIGTSNPAHKLSVNGTIKAKEVIVETAGWSDYVFADDYQLAPLSEVEAHIKAEKRLPGIPSEQQIAENGVSVGDMQAALLAKIEELTLHVIRQERRQTEMAAEIELLRAENAELRAGR